MNKYILILAIFLTGILSACGTQSNEQTSTNSTSTANENGAISAAEAHKRIKDNPKLTIVDVRTPEEYAQGHLENAHNIDWNSNSFENKIDGFERDKPILVYCLSGARSAAAAEKMRSFGFKNVLEMENGMMAWRAAQLPETTANVSVAKPAGMNRDQFDAALNSPKLVLIDFYADWCAPCKKMAPYLEEIKTEMGDKVEVVRINTDDSAELASQLSIEGLPTVLVYKNKTMIWKNVGYIGKEELVKHLQ
ncbi:thioredoxin [Runella sp. SP2]|nr:thioredoxin [Runella sp. SP2]